MTTPGKAGYTGAMLASVPFDYHSHHWRCGHAVGTLRDYALSAIDQGLTHFGVSDHGPAYWKPFDHAYPGTQMALSWLPSYLDEAHALKAELAGQLALAVGLEADFIEGHEAELDALLSAHPLDYVLGSVHYSLGKSIFDRRRWATENADTVFTDYYRQVILAAQSGLFDILSHLTAVEAYAPQISETLAAALYPPVADAVAASGCAVEINTSGYRKMPGRDEPFPNRAMLRLLIDRGVPLTFGGDSHKPEEVAFASDQVRALLTELRVKSSQNPQPITVRRGQIMAFATT